VRLGADGDAVEEQVVGTRLDHDGSDHAVRLQGHRDRADALDAVAAGRVVTAFTAGTSAVDAARIPTSAVPRSLPT
jgi:hypothetical protein